MCMRDRIQAMFTRSPVSKLQSAKTVSLSVEGHITSLEKLIRATYYLHITVSEHHMVTLHLEETQAKVIMISEFYVRTLILFLQLRPESSENEQ